MQVPEEWGHRKRAAVVAGTPSGGAAPEEAPATPVHQVRGARGLRPDELQNYARSVSVSHVALTSQALSCIGNDPANICRRVLDLLPDCEDGTAGTRKRVRTDDDNVQHTDGSSRNDMSLELDTLLSRLPYKRMMQDMLPHTTDRPVPSVPYVTRVYEETYMREPMHPNERPCVMQNACECMFIDREQPFIAVEFVVPGEEQQETPQMCVVCSRAHTQQLFYDIVFDNASFAGLIQRFGNLHDVQNEYARSVMLICPPNGPLHCMPLPIVSHQRNRYTVCKVAGIHYLRQHGVHFH